MIFWGIIYLLRKFQNSVQVQWGYSVSAFSLKNPLMKLAAHLGVAAVKIVRKTLFIWYNLIRIFA